MALAGMAVGLKGLGVTSPLLETGLVRRDGRIAQVRGVAMEDVRGDAQ